VFEDGVDLARLEEAVGELEIKIKFAQLLELQLQLIDNPLTFLAAAVVGDGIEPGILGAPVIDRHDRNCIHAELANTGSQVLRLLAAMLADGAMGRLQLLGGNLGDGVMEVVVIRVAEGATRINRPGGGGSERLPHA